MTIITRFILRFAALVAITVTVLSSVSVKASRGPEPPEAGPAAVPAPSVQDRSER